MPKIALSLQPSEAVVARAAATIYAAYVAAGKVADGKEEEWMGRAVKEAIWIARAADDLIVSDTEMG
jgi:hypothetical protein